MATHVGYRDMPGGTRKIRFSDELPRHLMCSTCGMLSMEMYQDEREHAFCHVCVTMQSPAAAIFCKYEDRDVPLDQLHEALDIIEIIKDQVVFCPNEELGCTAYSPLRTIQDHFLQCEKTKLLCQQCQQRIKGINWKQHFSACPRKVLQCQYCITPFPQIDLQTHEAVCAQNPNAVRSESMEQSNSSGKPQLTAPRPVKSVPRNVYVDEDPEVRESNSTANGCADGVMEVSSSRIPHFLTTVFAYLKIFGNNHFVPFLPPISFLRSFAVPFLGIVVVALCLRRRRQ